MESESKAVFFAPEGRQLSVPFTMGQSSALFRRETPM